MILILIFAYLALFVYMLKKNELCREEQNAVASIRITSKFEAFSQSLLIFTALLLVITNLLSVLHLCNSTFIFISWAIVLFVTVFLYAKNYGFVLPKLDLSAKSLYQAYIKPRLLAEKLMILICVILCVILFIGALFTVPYNYDSMTYHLGRIGHWIDNQSVNHFVTNIDRQIYSPVLAEYFLLHIMLLSGSDILVNFLQYFSMIISALFIYKSARLLGTKRPFATLAVFLFLTMPLTISQSVTTQNDLFAALWFAMFIYYFLWFIKRERLLFDREEIRNLISIGMIVGFAFITKTSVCASMIMFMPWLIIVRLKKKDKFINLLKCGGTAGISLFFVISESLVRNLLSSGTIMPDTASANIMVATKNVSYIIVNILKNFALIVTQHLSDALNGFICRIAIHVGAFLKVEVNHEAISFHGFDFITRMNRGDNMYSHDITPSALVGYLAVLSGVILIVYTIISLIKHRKDTKELRKSKVLKDTKGIENTDTTPKTDMKYAKQNDMTIGFGISSWLSLGFIMALLRWQPWGTRIMYPALAMTVIMIGHLIGICFKRMKHPSIPLIIFTALGVLLGYKSLAYNMEPALTNLAEGCENRMERYFRYNDRYDAYMELANCVEELLYKNVKNDEETPDAANVSVENAVENAPADAKDTANSKHDIGVLISGDGYDYPLWLLFKEELPNITLRHVRPDAPSAEFAPDILLWVEKELVEVGDTIEYGNDTYVCYFVSSTENKDAVFVKTTSLQEASQTKEN